MATYPATRLSFGNEWRTRTGERRIINPADESLLGCGLAACAFIYSASSIAAIANGVEGGNLAISRYSAFFAETPFGGVTDSGHGRESGTEGLGGYTVTKLVSLKIAA